MDPASLDAVSVILAALAAAGGAGAIDGVKTLAKDAVNMGPRKLVSLIRDRFRKKQDVLGDARLTVYQADPTLSNAEALRGHLIEAGVEHDGAIVALARQFLQDAGPAALGPGSVAATILTQTNKSGSTGFVGGQHVHHHNSSTPPSVRWHILRTNSRLYELWNVGEGAAHNLQVTANFPFHWPRDRGKPKFVAPDTGKLFIHGEELDFDIEPRWYSPVPVLEVSWTITPSREDPQYWEGDLPQYWNPIVKP
jgi:hypothetical protein